MVLSAQGIDTFVYAHWEGMKVPELMGVLKAVHSRGYLIFSFSYVTAWITKSVGFYLDPNLQLFSGPQYPASAKPNFGIFLDSSPDRWGKLLMRRRELAWARQEGRKENSLTELTQVKEYILLQQ